MEKLITDINNFDKDLDLTFLKKVGFLPRISDESKYNLLKKGWWNNYHFASSIFSYGLNISPELPVDKWYVMKFHKANSPITFAPNISSFFYFIRLNSLLKLKFYSSFKDKVDIIEEVSWPFLEIVNGTEYFKYFKDFFLNKTIVPDSEENTDALYLHFWNYFDKSYGHEVLRKLIKILLENPDIYVDQLDCSKLEHWKTRALSILVKRMYKLDINKESPTKQKFFWELFSSIYVYDAEQYFRSHQPATSYPSTILEDVISSLLFTNKHTDYIKMSPLYPAYLKMSQIFEEVYNLNSYYGLEHLEAAAIYDSELNDPIMSWNCLVNAAYWSGVNSKETLLPAWEAAIYLAEKHNWKDAHFALKSQYDWYLDYKKKNNL